MYIIAVLKSPNNVKNKQRLKKLYTKQMVSYNTKNVKIVFNNLRRRKYPLR